MDLLHYYICRYIQVYRLYSISQNMYHVCTYMQIVNRCIIVTVIHRCLITHSA